MKRIRTKHGAPASFSAWLKDNKEELGRKTEDEKVTGKHLWNFFRNSGDVADLRKVLVSDQGFICCYCGRRIENDSNTVIEHLHPKSKYKSLALHFYNLLASCQGGSKATVHLVQEGENLIGIAAKYGVDVGHLELVYVSIDELDYFQNKYDLENLSVGERLVIFPRSTGQEQHCDTRKGNAEISIMPTDDDCEEKFSYDLFDGKIKITEENAQTVKTLGLNANKYLNRLRKKSVEESSYLKQKLIEDFGHAKEEFNEKRLRLIKGYSEITDENPRLSPFCFVITYGL